MYKIRHLLTLEMKWSVVEPSVPPVLFVELVGAPECEVHECEEKHVLGARALLATFLGTDAFERAFDWVATVELPRLLGSEQAELSSSRGKLYPNLLGYLGEGGTND